MLQRAKWRKTPLALVCNLALLVGTILFGTLGCSQPSVEEEVVALTPEPVLVETRSPLQMFLDSSHIRISLKTMHDRHYLNYFRLETAQPDLHPFLVPQVRKYIIEGVHGGTLLDRFITAFQSRVTETELQQMNQWLNSPLGNAVTALEMGKFTDPNFQLKTVKYESITTERQALISEYVDTNNLVSVSINVLRLTKTGVMEGMQSGQAHPRKILPPTVTENDLVYARLNLLDHYSTLFQRFSQEELSQIVQISKNETYQKVSMAMNRALVMAFNTTASHIGRIIAQAAPQIQAEERRLAAEKAELEGDLVPETLPPVKKRHENSQRKREAPLPQRQAKYERPTRY